MSNLVPIDEPTGFEQSLLPTALDCWLISSDLSLVQPTMQLLSTCVNLNTTRLGQDELQRELNKPNVSPPDVLLLDEADNWEGILEYFQDVYGDSKPTSVLLTREADTVVMRQALRLGVKDVLTIPADPDDLYASLLSTAEDKLANSQLGKVTVFINAKGGMGATLLAMNTAHMLSEESGKQTVLVDTDSQFGCMNHLLGVQPKFTLSDALSQVDELDYLVIEGLLTKHKSGLRLITSRNDTLMTELPDEQGQNFARFLFLLRQNYKHVILDLSRGLENWTLPALSEANQVFLVAQQNIPALRDASQLLKQMNHLLGKQNGDVTVIANRYSKRVEISPDDFSKTLNLEDVMVIPNDFETVTTATNLGVPLREVDEKKPVIKSIRSLVERLEPVETKKKSGLFGLFK